MTDLANTAIPSDEIQSHKTGEDIAFDMENDVVRIGDFGTVLMMLSETMEDREAAAVATMGAAIEELAEKIETNRQSILAALSAKGADNG